MYDDDQVDALLRQAHALVDSCDPLDPSDFTFGR